MELLVYFLLFISSMLAMSSDNLTDLLKDLHQGPGDGGKSLFDSPMGGHDARSVAQIQSGLELVLVNA